MPIVVIVIVLMYYLLMTLGGANVWFNFSYGSRVDAPNDWLLNPQSSFLILFEKCKKSALNNIKVYTRSSMQTIMENLPNLKTQGFTISTLRLKHGMS